MLITGKALDEYTEDELVELSEEDYDWINQNPQGKVEVEAPLNEVDDIIVNQVDVDDAMSDPDENGEEVEDLLGVDVDGEAVETEDEPEITEEVVGETETTEEVGEEVKGPSELLIEDDDDRIIKLKYMKNDMDLPVKDIKKYAQIGIDAETKDYKVAISNNKRMEELGISQDDLQMLSKLKSGDVTALKGFIASSKLDLEDIRENVFEYEKEELEGIRQTEVPAYNPQFQQLMSTVSQDAHKNYNELENNFPGMAEFQQRLVDTASGTDFNEKDLANYDAFLYNLDKGVFNDILPSVNLKYANLSEYDRVRVKSNNDEFVKFITPMLEGYNGQTEPNVTPSATTPQATSQASGNQKPVSVDTSSKQKFAKGKGTPPPLTPVKKSHTAEVDELTEKYENMDDDKFDEMMRQGLIH